MNVSSSFASRSNQLEVSNGLEEMSKYESAVKGSRVIVVNSNQYSTEYWSILYTVQYER